MKGGGLLLSRTIDEKYAQAVARWPGPGLGNQWAGPKPFRANQVAWPSLTREGQACPGSRPKAWHCPYQTGCVKQVRPGCILIFG